MQNKKALVTGASEGIGNAFAKKLASEGYVITAVARNEQKLRELVSSLGTAHQFIVADLSTESGQKLITDELTKNHYDLLVNNAGVGVVGFFAETDIEKQISMMRLNCEAVVRLAHAFLKSAVQGDALINVSSTLAFTPMPSIGLYSATKSFVTAFSEILWFEQKKRGVFVMDLCPGITSTNFQTNAGGRIEDLPKNMAETPEQVVQNALKSLLNRTEPTVISGVKNKIFAGMSRVMPRKSLVSMMGKMM